MVTEIRDSEKSFEQLVGNHSGNALALLEDLWNDCVDKDDADLQAIIKAFSKQTEKWSTRLENAKVDNGDLVTEQVMERAKRYPSSDFGTQVIQGYDGKTGKKLEPVVKYFYKKGIGRLDVDSMTLKQFNSAQKNFDSDSKAFLESAEKFRKSQADWDSFKKNPDSYTDEEMVTLRKSVTSAEKAYDAALLKVGLSRDKFDKKGTDVKTYIKGLQQLKKSDIASASARLQILRSQIKLVQAILNKKRGNENIEKVRTAGNINTGMIDSEIETLVELPEEKDINWESALESPSPMVNA